MRKLKNILLLLSILIITVAFNFQHNPPSNWYQQFLLSLNGRSISDIAFLDSLLGYAVTGTRAVGDTNYILKTTNGGDNWQIINRLYRDFSKVQFLNKDTGFVSGGLNVSLPFLLKTTNGGLNWVQIMSVPGTLYYDDMFVLNADTIWLVDKNSFNGGVYRTTNGGGSWTQQYFAGSQNPNSIYFYNRSIGFMNAASSVMKTTDSGLNWFVVASGENFTDIHFVDAFKGWKCSGDPGYIKTTTNGGSNWTIQYIPPEAPPFLFSSITKFSFVNADTIWGVGGVYSYGIGNYRGVIYKTTNGGLNWGYQVPDTAIHIPSYRQILFVNNKHGWAYNTSMGGIHTKLGGDSTLTKIGNVNNQVASNFKLYQNYPNPFNPRTILAYELPIRAFVSIKIYNLLGKEITTLVNENKNAGVYEIGFDAGRFNLTSGVYFYTLEIENSKGGFREAKKMILVK